MRDLENLARETSRADLWEREPELTGEVEKLKAILRTLGEDAGEVCLAYSSYSKAIRPHSFYDDPEVMHAWFKLEDTILKLAKTLSVVAKVFEERGNKHA